MANPTQLNFGRDIQGFNAFAPKFSNNKLSATLTVGLEATFTIPSTYKQFIISFSVQPGHVVWVAVNETAAVPVGASFASTTSELNPASRVVNAGDVIHCISPDATTDIGVIIYARDL